MRPDLPDWLPDLTLRDLRVGRHVLDIAFRRIDGATQYEVLRGEPGAVVLASSLPQASLQHAAGQGQQQAAAEE